jgi:hypothetical protein
VWIQRRRPLHLARLRTKAANQLSGGFPREITAPHAAALLDPLQVSAAANAARAQLVSKILDSLRRLDLQLHELSKRLT